MTEEHLIRDAHANSDQWVHSLELSGDKEFELTLRHAPHIPKKQKTFYISPDLLSVRREILED